MNPLVRRLTSSYREDHPALWLLVFFCLAIFGYFLNLPPVAGMGILTLVVSLSVVKNPKNGLTFLLLITPFCLGNSKRDYFWLLEVFVAITLLSTWMHVRFGKVPWKGIWQRVPVVFWLLLFGGITVVSLPIDLKRILWDLKTNSLLYSGSRLVSAHEGKSVYYFRSVWHALSGLALFFCVQAVFRKEKEIRQMWKPWGILLGVVLLAGSAFRFDWIPHSGKYLTLQFFGYQPIMAGRVGITAFAFNSGYLGQYLVWMFPVAVCLLLFFNKSKAWGLYGLGLIGFSLFTMLFTYQRGPLIALFGEMVVLGGLLVYLAPQKKKGLIWAGSLLGGGLISIFLLDLFLFKGVGLARIQTLISNPSLRDQIWQVAIQMVKEYPLLGIGSGRFHTLFTDFCEPAGVAFSGHLKYTRTTAHSLYFHLLAEFGFLGFLTWLIPVVGLMLQACKQTVTLKGGERSTWVVLILMLGGFLAFGFSQHMFYLRSMHIAFWIVLGLLATLLREKSDKPCPESFPWKYLAIILGLLLAGRLIVVGSYTLNHPVL